MSHEIAHPRQFKQRTRKRKSAATLKRERAEAEYAELTRKTKKRFAARAARRAKRQAALQKRAVEKKIKSEKAKEIPIAPDLIPSLFTGAAIGLGGYMMHHLADKIFNRDVVKERVVDLVIEHGIKDVEAALAKIKSRIELHPA